MKVAVIGAGVFGAVIAWKLSQEGFDVEIFDTHQEILSGTTPKSVLRLHLGFHYPRDLETAVQSKEGYSRFLGEFGGSVDREFTNFYALSKNDSKVNHGEFHDFVHAAGLEVLELDPKELGKYGFAVGKIQALFSAPEGVIHPGFLRTELQQRLANPRVKTSLGIEVAKATFSRGFWQVYDSEDNTYGPFNFIIKATYGSDNIAATEVKDQSRAFDFHRTLVVRANLGMEKFGITIIDGDFLTLLPDAFAKTSLLYGPLPSVMKRHTGAQIPPDFSEESSDLVNKTRVAVIQRYREWFPRAPIEEHKEDLIGTRTIEHGVQATDRRVTEIREIGPQALSVLSGKIDHCFFAAEQVFRSLASGKR
jgi:hypothetical protein